MKPDNGVIRGNAAYWTAHERQATDGVFQWQPPLELSADLLTDMAGLCECDLWTLSEAILAGRVQVYRVKDCYIAVEPKEKTLFVCAIVQEGPVGSGLRELFLGTVKLARSWGLYQLQTHVDDPRLAKLLKLFGARTVRETLRLEV